MSQPTWITAAGSLGTIPEGIFYQVPIEAVANGEDIFFQFIAGQLPSGIQITPAGMIEGIPRNRLLVQGVPIDVSEDVTSKFAIRAYTTRSVNGQTVVDQFADRTFFITVSGQDAPEFVTPAGNVGTFYDGTPASIQIEFIDRDFSDRIQIRVLSGELPPGLVLDNSGLISGIIQPLQPITGTANVGYDNTPLDEFPFDFTTRGASRNYSFTLEVNDGKQSDVRAYEIYVYAKPSMQGSATDVVADTIFVTSDVTPNRIPLLLTPEGDLGRVRADNFYAYKFDGINFDNEPIEYEVTLGAGIGFDAAVINNTTGSFDFGDEGFDRGAFSLPPGLVIDPVTGWFYGYIPESGSTEITYKFAVRVKNTNDPTIVSKFYFFTITIVGAVETDVVWITNSDLGSINNGAVSTFDIQALNSAGRSLEYRLAPGSASRLPQGLTLQPSGHITGRVSFNTFALDGGLTTFDRNSRTRNVTQQTTFDSVYVFTVNAFASADVISVFKTFTIRVNRVFNQPYQGLYIKAMPPENDRALLQQLILNQDIIPVGVVYRPDDSNFGVAKSVVYDHAFGLNAATVEQYVESLTLNHYWKTLTLGKIEYAQARNASGEVIYEAVYSRVIDRSVNAQGQSVSKQLQLPYPVDNNSGQAVDVVYPNSLINMRDQVIDVVGQISPLLPSWMISKQSNGQVLGFTPAWVIAYVNPGQGAQVVYNIQQQFGDQLNQVDFKADRYEIDRRMTYAWEPLSHSTNAGRWIPAPPAATTFDLVSDPLLGTYFDGGTTGFITPADTTTTTDVFDKYLLFPKTNILA